MVAAIDLTNILELALFARQGLVYIGVAGVPGTSMGSDAAKTKSKQRTNLSVPLTAPVPLDRPFCHLIGPREECQRLACM